ncbi:MAG: hypothetical protein ACRBBP_09050 [Bdellovibrionales bacterium]
MLKIILCFLTLAVANTETPKTSVEETLKGGLVEPAVKDPLINEVVTYKPIKDHHFNLEAPQECGKESTIDPTARQITCQFHDSGNRQVRLSVCDNAKKYCKQELIDVAVRQKKSGIPRIKTSPTPETVKMQKQTKKLLMASFKSMSPDEAKQAVSTKKAALALVSTDWCPPCNMAKEFLLPTDKFKYATKDLLLIYIDGDSPDADAWAPILKSRFYPTFIVLNKDLESVGLFSDISSKTHLEKLKDSLTLLSDPYTALETRIDERIEESLLQKVKDFFASEESIDLDQKRFLAYLSARGKLKEEIKYMKAFSSEKYKNELLAAEQKTFLFGQQDPKLSEEDAKKRKEELAKLALTRPIEGNDFYSYSLQSFCASTQDKETKENSKKCKGFTSKYEAHLDKNKEKDWDKILPSEKLISEANYFSEKASLAELSNNKKEAASNYASCFQAYNKLYQHSPLKTKSRSVRLQQLYCLTDDDSQSEEKFKVLTSLVKDYPFEETFQRKLASHYLKKKDYKIAAEYNEKALKYSYGALWAYNMSAKAKIQQGLKKDKEALLTLEEALGEFVLEKEGRSSGTIKMLRGQYEALKTSLAKSNI